MKFIVRTLLAIVYLLGLVTLAFYFFRPRPSAEISDSVRKCPVIADVSVRPLGDLEFNGPSKKWHHDGYDDVFLFDHDQKIKVAVREQWGGSVVFFGEGESNLIDASEYNRGMRLAFHDSARAFQGCAHSASCAKSSAKPCQPTDEHIGWNPQQAGNRCGELSGVEDIQASGSGLVLTTMPLLFNPGWNLRTCDETKVICENPKFKNRKSHLRVSQSLRFVKSHILEVEVQVTNLSEHDVRDGQQDPQEMPALFVNPGKDGSTGPMVLKNANGSVLEEDQRQPAASENILHEVHAPQGWAAYQSADSDRGIGIYWENRSEVARAERKAGVYANLRSGFPFTLPAYETVRSRFYLLLGGYDQVKGLAQDLDNSLPPFGRIDVHRIEDDTRTVTVEGWALDNKGIRDLELWVDGKKVSDLKLNVQRDDVCATYPGYGMCTHSQFRVGFAATYPRPEGAGCARPVEIRARDTDGNWRVIARRSVDPVEY